MSTTSNLITAEFTSRGTAPASRNAVLTALEADDRTLARHLEAADIPTLLLTTAHLSGDYGLLRPAWRPAIDAAGVVTSGMSAGTEREVRALCRERLGAFRDARGSVPSRPTTDQLRLAAEWMMGPAIEPYLPLIAEELVTADADPRRPLWTKAQVAPQRDFHVAIVGAGESGLALAFRLRQAGVPFTLYEKNAEVGGTWLENHYPGCRVDINSFYYSYSFARRTWKDYYSTSQDVLEYLKDVAQDAGLYEHIRFGCEVRSMAWDDDAQQWTLEIAGPDGIETVCSNMAVSAVGQLNRPKLPDIPGIGTFNGPAFHSARWDHDVDLTGKRVAVIGTGASAVQFIKSLAQDGVELGIFARTTNWLLPTPNLRDAVTEGQAWLLDHLPNYALWYRASLVMVQAVGLLDDIAVDPHYPPTERATSARNEALRESFLRWLEPQVADRPDLRDVVIPDSPVGAKRIIRDDGGWVETLKRDNVRVIREPIEAITPRGIRCADGTEHEFDVIIYGTGFEASKFLMPMQVTGRGGVDLHQRWQDDARAYLGTAMPDFPNLFCMYGPNTNLVVYGSIIMFSEQTAQYIVDAARLLLESGSDALEVKAEVHDSYNDRVEARNRLLAFGFSRVNSWYKNSRGRVTQNCPFPAYEFWQRTKSVDATDYDWR